MNVDWVLYARQPRRRARQIAVDVAFVVWVVIAVRVAVRVHAAVAAVAERTRGIDAASSRLDDGLSRAGDVLGETPIVGGRVDDPFDAAARSSADIARSAADTASSIDTLATVLALATMLVMVLLVTPYYVPARLRFIVTATLTRRLAQVSAASPGTDMDLLALRALARQPLRRLRRIPGAADGWRNGDPTSIAALAALELRSAGPDGAAGRTTPPPPPDRPHPRG